MDREAQIRAIEKTFEDAKIPIEKHYSKPGVVPLEVLPVFPDFKVQFIVYLIMKCSCVKCFLQKHMHKSLHV